MLPDELVCKNCGNRIKNENRCLSCHASLTSVESKTTYIEFRNQGDTKKSAHFAVAYFSILSGLIGSVCIGFYYMIPAVNDILASFGILVDIVENDKIENITARFVIGFCVTSIVTYFAILKFVPLKIKRG